MFGFSMVEMQEGDMHSTRGSRPADLAIAGNRMLLELLHMIFLRRYSSDPPKRFGAALELMMVSMLVSVTTRDGKPLTASGIAKKLLMPRSNVDRHLKHLVARGAVALEKRRWCADLDVLDSYMMSKAHLDRAIHLVQACLNEFIRLRIELREQLR
jgi:predicted transcriptional regulator